MAGVESRMPVGRQTSFRPSIRLLFMASPAFAPTPIPAHLRRFCFAVLWFALPIWLAPANSVRAQLDGLPTDDPSLRDPALGLVDEKDAYRRHQDGPLKRAEFKAKPPNSGRAAYTRTDLRFTYRTKFTRVGNSVLIRLTESDVYAIFIPEESWMRKSAPDDLMDHEQGHFDLTEIYALKAQHAIQLKHRSYSLTGDTKSECEKKLQARMKEDIQRIFAQCEERQREYDYQTEHGLRPDAQRLHRREQKAELLRWRAKLKR